MTVLDVATPESPDDATLAALELPDSPTAPHLKNPLAQRHLSPSKLVLQRRLSECNELELASQQSGTDSPDHDRASSSMSTPSPTKMKRFLPTTSEEGGLDKWNQFYSDDAVKQRVKLMKHPRVKLALDDLWTAANFNADDDIIDRDEYLMMHRKIVLALEPTTAPAEAAAAALEDWPRDSEGKAGLDKDRFRWAWFELADLWTNTMEAEEYEEFLTSTMELITKRTASGAVVWRDDQDVMRAHFRRRRERGLRVSEENRSTWRRAMAQVLQGPARDLPPDRSAAAPAARQPPRRSPPVRDGPRRRRRRHGGRRPGSRASTRLTPVLSDHTIAAAAPLLASAAEARREPTRRRRVRRPPALRRARRQRRPSRCSLLRPSSPLIMQGPQDPAAPRLRR